MKSRREFLRSCRNLALTGGAAGFTRLGRISALAQSSSTYRSLVCIFLFGGNDNNNTVAPVNGTAYTDYANARRGLAIPRRRSSARPAAHRRRGQSRSQSRCVAGDL